MSAAVVPTSGFIRLHVVERVPVAITIGSGRSSCVQFSRDRNEHRMAWPVKGRTTASPYVIACVLEDDGRKLPLESELRFYVVDVGNGYRRDELEDRPLTHHVRMGGLMSWEDATRLAVELEARRCCEALAR